MELQFQPKGQGIESADTTGVMPCGASLSTYPALSEYVPYIPRALSRMEIQFEPQWQKEASLLVSEVEIEVPHG